MFSVKMMYIKWPINLEKWKYLKTGLEIFFYEYYVHMSYVQYGPSLTHFRWMPIELHLFQVLWYM